METKIGVSQGDLDLKLEDFAEICDKGEEEQPEIFGPKIKLDLGTGSSIYDLGEPPIEAIGEEHAVEVIRVETSEEKPDEEMGTGDSPFHRVGEGDSFFGDYPRDDFEKVGEINLVETPQTPSEPVLTVHSGETPTSGEPRSKRIKTLAGRTDLPLVRKMLAQHTQTSPSSHQSSHKEPTQLTHKSHWLAAEGIVRRSSSTKQGPPVIEEIESSPKGSPIKSPETPVVPQDSPVLASEQAFSETSPK